MIENIPIIEVFVIFMDTKKGARGLWILLITQSLTITIINLRASHGIMVKELG